MVQPRFITIKGVVNAATTNNPADGETTFRSETGKEPVTMVSRYMRTSVRIIVLRDKFMNEKGFVEYDDVYEDHHSMHQQTRICGIERLTQSGVTKF